MKVFSRLFSKAQRVAPTLDERIAALAAATPDVMLSTALGSGDKDLRLAAIRMLPDGDGLRKLAGVSASAEGADPAVPTSLKRAARTRLAQLIDEGSVDFAEFCAEAGSRNGMFSVAVLCQDTGLLPQALAAITDPARLAQLAVEGPSGRLRQLAAQAVDDPAQLRQLLKQVRNRDRAVYQILKDKCDALQTEERKPAEITSEANDVGEISALCAALELHSHRSYNALYTSTFDQLSARWRALKTQPDAGSQQRARQAIDRCQEIVAGHLRHTKQQADDHAAEEARGRAQRVVQQADHVAEEARGRAQRVVQQADHVAEEARGRAQRVVQQADDHVAEEVRGRTQQVVQAAARSAALEPTEAQAQLRRAAVAVRQVAEIVREEQLLLNQLAVLIGKADDALSDGNTRKAAILSRAIEEKWPLPPAEPADPSRLLQQLDEELNALDAREDPADIPTLIEPAVVMQALSASAEEPGVPSKRRRENQENRKTLLERLLAFEARQNWDQLDWRQLARVVREAPQEWRQYSPADGDAVQDVQEKFESVMGRLQSRFDAWYERSAP
ncbi:MAG: hypothetical protein ABSH33_05785 [Steroidobacteraceae bacterium]|jgi:hypothetical protein